MQKYPICFFHEPQLRIFQKATKTQKQKIRFITEADFVIIAKCSIITL